MWGLYAKTTLARGKYAIRSLQRREGWSEWVQRFPSAITVACEPIMASFKWRRSEPTRRSWPASAAVHQRIVKPHNRGDPAVVIHFKTMSKWTEGQNSMRIEPFNMPLTSELMRPRLRDTKARFFRTLRALWPERLNAAQLICSRSNSYAKPSSYETHQQLEKS